MISYIERLLYFMLTICSLALGFAVITMFFYVGPAMVLAGIAALLGVAAALLLVVFPSLKKQWIDLPSQSTDEEPVVMPQASKSPVASPRKVSGSAGVARIAAPGAKRRIAGG